MIPPELFEYIESGISILVGSRSDRLLAEYCRGLGARVEAAGRELSVFLAEATAAETLENFRNNGRVAVCFSRAADHRSLQIKGSVISLRPADEEERRLILRYRGGLAETWGQIGIPPRITLRIAHWPAIAVRLSVETVFDQTPGPGAGGVLGAVA